MWTSHINQSSYLSYKTKEVKIWSLSGQSQVFVTVKDFLEEEPSAPEVVAQIADKITSFINESKGLNYTTTKLEIKLPFYNSGGNSLNSILGTYLAKLGGEKRLILILERENDPGSKTVCLYNIKCPKVIDENFKLQLIEHIEDLLQNGTFILYERSQVRKKFFRRVSV
ncbi:MAG: hypothetical protein HYY52_02350 [Candidatus Melainabacteria bacterium]|nr:hypothetical protein [Candidatus Melainabacteria bacterium]